MAQKLSRSSQQSVAIEVQCYVSDDDGVMCRSDSFPASQTSSQLDTAAGTASEANSSTITSIRSLKDCPKRFAKDLKWLRAWSRIRSSRKSNTSNSSALQKAFIRDSSACSDASKLSSALHKGQETTPEAIVASFKSSYAQGCSWAAGAARSLKHSSRCLLQSCLTPRIQELDDDYLSPQLLEDLPVEVQQGTPSTAADTPVVTPKGTAADPPSATPSDTTENSSIEPQQAADEPVAKSAAALASATSTPASAPPAITPAAETVAGQSEAPIVACAAAQPGSSTSVEGRVASDDKVNVVDASYETARATQVCKACHSMLSALSRRGLVLPTHASLGRLRNPLRPWLLDATKAAH